MENEEQSGQNPNFSAQEALASAEGVSGNGPDSTQDTATDEGGVPSPALLQEEADHYASELSARIYNSGAKKVRITHSDYKKLYRAGLTKTKEDNAPLSLVTGVLLEVDTSEGAVSGTFMQLE